MTDVDFSSKWNSTSGIRNKNTTTTTTTFKIVQNHTSYKNTEQYSQKPLWKCNFNQMELLRFSSVAVYIVNRGYGEAMPSNLQPCHTRLAQPSQTSHATADASNKHAIAQGEIFSGKPDQNILEINRKSNFIIFLYLIYICFIFLIKNHIFVR